MLFCKIYGARYSLCHRAVKKRYKARDKNKIKMDKSAPGNAKGKKSCNITIRLCPKLWLTDHHRYLSVLKRSSNQQGLLREIVYNLQKMYQMSYQDWERVVVFLVVRPYLKYSTKKT